MSDRLIALVDEARQELQELGDIVVACSGGADSTALALVCDETGVRFRLAHVNHHLRAEAHRDEALTRLLAEELGVPLEVHHLDPDRLRADPRGVEASAREARYAALARRLGPGETLLTAHTAGDRLTTVLMRLAQGAGIAGLGGPAARTTIADVPVVRPLRRWWPDDVRHYLALRGRETVAEDPTNDDPAFLRSRLDHEVAAPLRRAASGDALQRALDLLGRDSRALRELAEHVRATLVRESTATSVTLDRPRLATLPPDARASVIHATIDGLSGVRPSGTAIDEIAAGVGTPGATVLGPGLRVEIDAERATFAATADPRQPLPSPPIPDDHLAMPALGAGQRSLGAGRCAVEVVAPPGDEAALRFDADALAGPLELRPVSADDTFVPFGRARSRGVLDQLARDGVRVRDRKRALVLVAGDAVLAVEGGRRSNVAQVGPKTRRVLLVRWSER